MIHDVEIDGKMVSLDLPDDATPDEIDSIINEQFAAPAAAPAPAVAPSPVSKFEETLFPRTSALIKEDAQTPGGMKPGATAARGLLSPLADAASIPGRAIASVPALMPGGESYGEAFARTKGKERPGILGAVSKFAGDVVRSPVTAVGGMLSKPIAGVMGKVMGPLASKAGGKILSNVAQGLPFMAAAQGERVAEGRGLSGVEAGIDVAADVALPVAGMALTKAALPAAKWIAQAAGMKWVGEGLEAGGKKVLRGGAKIKDATAKRVSGNVEKGAQQFVDNVSAHKLQSTTGGFKGISENAQKAIDAAMDEADAAIKGAAKEAPGTTVDVDEVFLTLIDDIQKGNLPEAFGKEERAAEVAANIYKALELRKMAGAQPIETVPVIKQTMSEGMELFKKGIAQVAQDPVERRVGDIAYLRIKDALNETVPGLKEINKKTHDLIEVRRVADEATKRIGNHNTIGLNDMFILFGGPSAAAAMGIPMGAPAAGAVGAGLIAKKALGGGRGASALMSAGQALKTPAGRTALQSAAGGGLGYAVGGQVGTTEEERKRNALIGAGLGAGAPVAANLLKGAAGLVRRNAGKLADESGAVQAGGAGEKQTVTPQFKKWFGDWENAPETASKVVDAEGKPLVVYHGTPDGRFLDESGVFQSQKERFGMGKDRGAHWFASSEPTAKSYANDARAFDYQNAEPKVVPTYLDMKKPLVIDGKGREWRDAQRIGKTSDVIERAQSEGYDGVIIKNVKDDYNNAQTTKPTDTFVVFSPSQIKSATGNSGAFSPTNPDIRGVGGLGTLGMMGAASVGALGATAGVAAIKGKKKRNLLEDSVALRRR